MRFFFLKYNRFERHGWLAIISSYIIDWYRKMTTLGRYLPHAIRSYSGCYN